VTPFVQRGLMLSLLVVSMTTAYLSPDGSASGSALSFRWVTFRSRFIALSTWRS